jgi:glycine/D-amino acid oxidase-like deaminating enzyme/nitrite reductase/ring-hydroxylating ferredoxin subunit
MSSSPRKSEKSVSTWMRTDMPLAQPLPGDVETDVCIVGAGIAGLSTAYHLALAGLSVVVLDDGPIGGGQTCRTTAHLTNVLDERYHRLEQLHGREGARLAALSHSAAIARIRQIAATEKIECDLERVDGFLFNPPGKSPQELSKELKAAHRAGLTETELVSGAPMDFFETGPSLCFPHQAQFHPLKYLRGLADAILNLNGNIYSRAHVIRVQGGTTALAETRRGHTVRAQSILVATHTPINDRIVVHPKQAAYRSYVIAARVPKDSVVPALYWDTAEPYHYVRIKRGARNDQLIVGGEDHKTGQMPQRDPYLRLEQWAKLRFPMIEAVDYRWSGQIMEPMDGLSFIGRNPGDTSNVYIATGDSGNGMTYGTISGMLISDLILERPNPWAALYDPARKRLRATGEFMRENLNVAVQYSDWLTHGDVDSLKTIKPGSGAVVRNGLSKIAVYRDEKRGFHEFSAVCPHLGCVVAWNDKEQTWDCPCHGSRFEKLGRVIHGPAMQDLAPLPMPQPAAASEQQARHA